MQRPRINAIAAIGKNRELGRNNELIWRISADLQRLKRLTMGHPLIMGRKTFESIGKPLPGRQNIIVSRDPDYQKEGCVVARSLEEALLKAADADEVFIFGGAQIYKEAMPYIDRLYLTLIDAEAPDADTFFPAYDGFSVLERETRDQDGLAYEWLTLERQR